MTVNALMPLKTVGNVTHFSACQQIFFRGVGGSHEAVFHLFRNLYDAYIGANPMHHQRFEYTKKRPTKVSQGDNCEVV